MIAAVAKKTKPTTAEPLATLTKATDAMHAMLVARADALVGCTENSP